uniref:Thrombospondin type 1 domain containing 4 n=1 Tax=Latimeria chalumnae TaxID=7897 RepID=H3BHK0_LATCH
QVPQRIEVQNNAAEETNTGIPGMWGSWGPWSACSRTCNGGVMEQTRPCLPAYYQYPHHYENTVNPHSGHVISAIRTSVPLHRNEGQLRTGLQSSVSGGRNGSHFSRGILRGSRQPQSQGRDAKKIRGRMRSSIVPGKYGYGKAPYILPLQTDTGQLPQSTRRQRQSSGQHRHQHHRGQGHLDGHNYSQHLSLYQGGHNFQTRPQAPGSSVYRQTSSYAEAFPSSQGLFPGTATSIQSSVSHQVQHSHHPQSSVSIVCVGAYKQYKLCNPNRCPDNSRSIREVQCATYNNKPFMGRFYEWEPFTE